MSVSHGKATSQKVPLATLAVPVPSVALFAVGAPSWLCVIAILLSALVAFRPIQVLILHKALTFAGGARDEAREWAFRAVYYRASPDPTLQYDEKPAIASPPAILSLDGNRTSGADGADRMDGA